MNSKLKNSQATIIAALLIGVGLFLSGLMIRFGIGSFVSNQRVVTVKGLAEREVAADHVIWPLMYKMVGNEVSDIYYQIGARNKAITDFLKSNGIDDAEITVSAPEIIDMEAERYNSQPVLHRFNVTSVVTVSSGKVDLIRRLMVEQTDLLKKGVAITGGDYRYSTQFLFNGLNDIKPQMIEEATQNARLTAEKFAHDSQSRLGKIKHASQGQFSINDRDANTPHIKAVRVVTTIDYFLKD